MRHARYCRRWLGVDYDEKVRITNNYLEHKEIHSEIKAFILYRNNVSYASTCNGTGLGLGMFVGSIFPVLLVSEDFCNKYLRITSGTGGIMTFKSTYVAML